MKSSIEFNPEEISTKYDSKNRLKEYIRILLEENKRVNLVSRETTVESARLMALKSLLPLDYLELKESKKTASYLDIGSGGGLPAIPLLLSGSINGRAVLMERIGKKAAATANIISALGLKAQVLPESFPWGKLDKDFDLITLKWVKLDSKLLTQIAKYLSASGKLVHYSSESMSSEILSSHTYNYEDTQTGVTKGFTIYQKINKK